LVGLALIQMLPLQTLTSRMAQSVRVRS